MERNKGQGYGRIKMGDGKGGFIQRREWLKKGVKKRRRRWVGRNVHSYKQQRKANKGWRKDWLIERKQKEKNEE